MTAPLGTPAKTMRRARMDSQLQSYIVRWQREMTKCAELELEYQDRLRAWRKKNVHLGDTAAAADFDKSWEGRSLASQQEWAHRRAQTYAQAVLVLRELGRAPEMVPYYPAIPGQGQQAD